MGMTRCLRCHVQREDARLPEVLSMGTLTSAYAGQHSDAAPLSMMPQQQQQQTAPQVLTYAMCIRDLQTFTA